MAQFSDAWLQGQDRRFTRPDARRWVRPDAHRWLRPEAERWLRPDDEDWSLLKSGVARSRPRTALRLETDPISVGQLESAARLEALRIQSDRAAEEVLVQARRLAELLRKYLPDQPRVPAGSSEGGQWTSDDRQNELQEAQEPSNDDLPVHIVSENRPPPRGAGLRFALQIAHGLIKAYRRKNGLYDMFGDERGTVALTAIDGKLVFGTNSGVAEFSTAYTSSDDAAAKELRSTMLWKYPELMNLEDIGRFPNDALFHAETTALLRARDLNGGTLEGREITIFVDGDMCPSCEELLRKVGLELGDPRVTFVDRRGRIRVMKNGKWQ